MKDKDLLVNLLRTIEEQNKTIDKLADKIIALGDARAYFALNNETEGAERMTTDENPDLVDPDLVNPEDRT